MSHLQLWLVPCSLPVECKSPRTLKDICSAAHRVRKEIIRAVEATMIHVETVIIRIFVIFDKIIFFFIPCFIQGLE